MFKKKDPKCKKNILIVDNNGSFEQSVRDPLLKKLEVLNIFPIFVRAKDGADAAMKSENQKFDIVIIDTEIPRLMDGGFVQGIPTYKNTQDATVFVLSGKENSEIPEPLRGFKFFKKPVSPDDVISALITAFSNTGSAASAAKYAVDVRVINAVIKATTNVLGQFGVASVKMEKAGPKPAQDPLMGEISAVIDIKSQSFQGYLSISFDKGSFLEVVSAMLMEEQTELNQENQDAVGEINNIIFGNAKSEITSYGVQMTTPRVLLGSGKCVPCDPGSAGMLIPFSTEKGKFYLTVVALPVAVMKAA